MSSTRGIETRVKCASQSMYFGGEDKQYTQTHTHTHTYLQQFQIMMRAVENLKARREVKGTGWL